jgi:hypothetical protein
LQPGTLFTRSAFEAAGGLDLSFSLAMDFDLWLRMLETGTKAVYVPGVLARFEIHSRSKTGRERGIAFAAEEARALLRVQQVAGAAASIRSWTRQDAMNDVLTALESGDRATARRLATEASRSYDPVMNRGRLFLWLARIAPRIARAVSRTARR